MVLYDSLKLRDLADLIMTVKLKNYKGGNFTLSLVSNFCQCGKLICVFILSNIYLVFFLICVVCIVLSYLWLVFKHYVSCICSGFAASHWSTTCPYSRTATERRGEAWWSSSLHASSNSRTTGWVYNQAFHRQDHVRALFKLSSSCNILIYRICLCLGISSARLSSYFV